MSFTDLLMSRGLDMLLLYHTHIIPAYFTTFTCGLSSEVSHRVVYSLPRLRHRSFI